MNKNAKSYVHDVIGLIAIGIVQVRNNHQLVDYTSIDV